MNINRRRVLTGASAAAAAGVLPAAGTMAQAAEPSPATMTTAELLTAREEANAACWDRMQRHLALCEELERRGAVEPSEH